MSHEPKKGPFIASRGNTPLRHRASEPEVPSHRGQNSLPSFKASSRSPPRSSSLSAARARASTTGRASSSRRRSSTGVDTPPREKSRGVSPAPGQGAQSSRRSRPSLRLFGIEADEDVAARRNRKLSFVDCSLAQVQAAIESANEQFLFDLCTWEAILSGSPSPQFKAFQNRTLTFWVKCFNKWRDIRAENVDIAHGDFVNGNQLLEMVPVSKFSIQHLVELFDPQGAARINSEGMTAASFKSIRIPAVELMMAGVMLSRLISTKNKFSFALGLVDFDSSRMLNRLQFAVFVKAFMFGLGCAFGVDRDSLPNAEDIQKLAKLLYERIGHMASCRIKDIYSTGDDAIKSAVIAAIKERCGHVNVPNGFATKLSRRAGVAKDQQLSFDVLRDWCYGGMSDEDPLALPFRLAIERFCPKRHGAFADEYDECLDRFSLSHMEPVPLPPEGANVNSKDLLTRLEVAYFQEVIRYCCHAGRLRLSIEDLHHVAAVRNMDISRHRQAAVCKALECISLSFCPEGDDDLTASEGLPSQRRPSYANANYHGICFLDLARQVCPLAQPKHLRMFQCWLDDYHALRCQKSHLKVLEKARAEFSKNDDKSFLPEADLQALEREFDRLDTYGNGHITLEDIRCGWGWSIELARDTLSAYDSAGDGCIDKIEFLRMMCPEGSRLPEMSGPVREMFGQFLSHEAKHERSSILDHTPLYTSGLHAAGGPAKEAPHCLLPVVQPEVWESWQQVFSSLDKNNDGKVQVTELLSLGVLSAPVCRALGAFIEPADQDGFTRVSFLDAMLNAHDVRAPVSHTTTARSTKYVGNDAVD